MRMTIRRPARALLFAAALAVFCQSGRPGALAGATPPAAPLQAAECGGDACPSVTLNFDEAKGQYRAHNNSPDRWVRVSASNFAAASSACLGPGGEGHLVLKSIVGPYRAEYVESGCGQVPGGE